MLSKPELLLVRPCPDNVSSEAVQECLERAHGEYAAKVKGSGASVYDVSIKLTPECTAFDIVNCTCPDRQALS